MTFYKVEWALDAAFTNPSQAVLVSRDSAGTAAETFRQEISQYGIARRGPGQRRPPTTCG